jgi:CRISPR-associated protein Cas5d
VNKCDAKTVRVQVTGSHACFRRPEFVDDLITYDVMPPLVASRMLSLLSVPPTARWRVKRLWVLNPIAAEWQTLRTSRGSKRALVLRDVAYVVEAQPMIDEQVTNAPSHHPGGLLDQNRSAHLGLADFKAAVTILPDSVRPETIFAERGPIDLGWMIYDLDGTGRSRARFFRALMIHGLIELDATKIPSLAS